MTPEAIASLVERLRKHYRKQVESGGFTYDAFCAADDADAVEALTSLAKENAELGEKLDKQAVTVSRLKHELAQQAETIDGLHAVIAAHVEADRANAERIAGLRKALDDIQAYGDSNPGYGYTCANMARAALNLSGEKP